MVKYIGQEKIVTVAQWNGIKFLFPLVRKQVVSRLNSEAFLTESHGKCTADTLSEPLKSAVEFTLATFYASSAAIEAKKFLASLPSMTTTDAQLKAKIDAAYYTLMNDANVWLNLEDLPHEQWRDVVGYERLYQVSNMGRVKNISYGDGAKIRKPVLNSPRRQQAEQPR